MNKTSQTQRLFNCLSANANLWLSLVSLVEIGCGYHVAKRASELREQGHTIENKKVYQADGSVHSYYRLVKEKENVEL